MELKLCGGAYLPDGKGDFETVSGLPALLQRILMKLTAKKGAFMPMPEFGSELYRVMYEKPSERLAAAKKYAAEALADETEISLADAALRDTAEGAELTLRFDYKGETLTVSLEI